MTASIFNLFSRGLSHLAAMSKFDLGGNSTAYAKKQHRKNFQEFISSMVDAILSHSGTLIVQAYSLLLCLKLPSFNSAQFSHLVVSYSATPWTAARQASLSITNSRSPPKPMSIKSAMPSNHLILCCPLLLLPSIFPSIMVFSNESALYNRWPKYWSFSFNISPSKEYSGLISFTIDWLDLLAVQGTLKSLLQHHSSKASILQCSAFFTVQHYHWKNHSLD